MIAWLHISGPEMRQNFMWWQCVVEEVLYLMTDRKQSEPGQDIAPKDLPPVTESLQPGPIIHSSTTSQLSIQILSASVGNP
jgi:hypothetical protein